MIEDALELQAVVVAAEESGGGPRRTDDLLPEREHMGGQHVFRRLGQTACIGTFGYVDCQRQGLICICHTQQERAAYIDGMHGRFVEERMEEAFIALREGEALIVGGVQDCGCLATPFGAPPGGIPYPV